MYMLKTKCWVELYFQFGDHIYTDSLYGWYKVSYAKVQEQ